MFYKLVGMLMVMTGADTLSLHQSCSTDRDCSQLDTYCYQSGKCVSCTDCNLYNRFPGTVCAKDKNQCGLCLPGMETEQNLDGTFSCHPSGTLTPSTQMPGLGTSSTTIFTTPIIIATALVLIICFGFCVHFLFKYKNACVLIRNICPNNSLMNTGDFSKCPDSNLQSQQSEPPPYSESNPTAPPFEDPPASSEPPIYQKVYRIAESDPNQTANVYVTPSYIRGGNLGANPEPDEPEDEFEAAENDALINATSISHPDDEETQPSTWTPTPGSEMGSAVGPTNFTGALSFEQLRISQPDVSFSVQQGSSSRSNSHPSIQFTSQSQTGNSENSSDGNTQQINIIAHVGPVYINPTVSK